MPQHRLATEDSFVGVGRDAAVEKPTGGSGVPPSRLVPAAAGLAALGVSQPLLDLLARQPEFLIAHGLAPVEVILLAVVAVLLPTAAFGLLGFLGSWRSWIAGSVVGLPVLLILLHVGGRLGLEGVSLLIMGVVGAGIGASLYARSRHIQDPGRYLAVVPAVVLVYFFVVLPPAVLNDGGAGSEAGLGEVANPVPVVIVIFDELPVASLIDSEGALLEDQFPSFARLAADGTWYRNAITVETSTTESIPAILSGVRISDGLVPNAAHHPRTLLTMLASSYDVAAVEPVTELCPETICPDSEPSGGVQRWAGLASDLTLVYGHLVVPAPWVERLPPVDQNWTGFATEPPDPSWDVVEAVGEAVERDRREDVARFLALLEKGSERPFLRIAHFVLPHRPWEFMPDGTPHGQQGVDGYGPREWGSDGFFVAEAWRRHLLQVGYADTVVGSVIDRLEQARIYESSMVVVVADHGVRFQPDTPDMRVTDRASYGSILPVPLFVKYPADLAETPAGGTIDDRRVETIDVAPTVVDVLDAHLGDVELDGLSLLSDFSRPGSEIELRGEPFPVGGDGEEKLEVAREKESWFPGGDPWSLVPDPALRPLLGESLSATDDPAIELATTGSEPPLIEGTVTSTEALTGKELVALTADGVVVAITKVFGVDGDRARFSFLVDPTGGYEDPLQAWLLLDGPTLAG